ncbi:hypothetical protein F2Q70_00032800 [Brassica cretica]|uniref:Uncharacterized protein n=1 Tax=Brassica cretica TaxID=69181 RepID=A0A8S9FHE7_BRACR|nr:hypothetical protein F2Q70_00032800 [Brassica cretica]
MPYPTTDSPPPPLDVTTSETPPILQDRPKRREVETCKSKIKRTCQLRRTFSERNTMLQG